MSSHELARLAAIVQRSVVLGAIALATAFAPTPALADNPFGSWAAIVVAGDRRAQSGGPSEAFDNARRDVTQELIGLGFSPNNIRQFSTQPQRYPNEPLLLSQPNVIYNALGALVQDARGGCLVYFSSHGNQQGVVVGDVTLSPQSLAQIVNDNCGGRPSVIVISACYSGVFVPALAAPTRMVITAARPDRSSFGCSESDRYPYFDACFLEQIPTAHDFIRLGAGIAQCVSRREDETDSDPPSEPQISIGEAIAPALARYAFGHGVGACGVTTTDPADAGGC